MKKYIFTVKKCGEYLLHISINEPGLNISGGDICWTGTSLTLHIDWAPIFYEMCREPRKALLYSLHGNIVIKQLSRYIIQCKEPIEVRHT